MMHAPQWLGGPNMLGTDQSAAIFSADYSMARALVDRGGDRPVISAASIGISLGAMSGYFGRARSSS